MFFISGMFRSGTTTIARALNAHPCIACASDPMTELFKSFRSDVASSLGQKVPVMAPLADYYYDEKGLSLLNELMSSASFGRDFEAWSRNDLIETLTRRCKLYCGALVPFLSEVGGQTYQDYFDSIVNIIGEAYGGDEADTVGFKEVWCNEFVPVLARLDPEMKFVFIIRDPRAVCASKKMQEEQYPWTFLARQWRKLAAIQWMLRKDSQLEGRVLEVRQEDFLGQPNEILKSLCDFLGVEWHPDVGNPARYKDGDGNPWFQNTSYGNGGQTFDKGASERWRDVLTKREISLVEYICGPEMSLFDYSREMGQEVFDDSTIFVDPPYVPDGGLAQWMNGVVPNSQGSEASLLAVDSLRQRILSYSCEERKRLPDAVVEAAFLSRRVLESLS